MRSHPLVQAGFCIDRRRPVRARAEDSHVLWLIAVLFIVVVEKTPFGVIARADAETLVVWLLHSGDYLGLHCVEIVRHFMLRYSSLVGYYSRLATSPDFNSNTVDAASEPAQAASRGKIMADRSNDNPRDSAHGLGRDRRPSNRALSTLRRHSGSAPFHREFSITPIGQNVREVQNVGSALNPRVLNPLPLKDACGRTRVL